MKIKTALLGLVAGFLVCLFAYQYVYRDIEKVRFKLLEAPVAASTERAVVFRYVNPRPFEARILAIRINNYSKQAKTFRILLNQTSLSGGSIQPKSAGRLLVHIPMQARCVRCRIIVSSDHTEWGLQTVEVRNMFGFSSAWLKAVVVDDEFKSYSNFRIVELLLIFFLTILMAVRLLDAISSTSRVLIIPAFLIVLSSLVLVILPFFSSYRVLLSPTAFAKLWILCFIPVWITAYRQLREKPNFKPILVAAVVASIFIGGMLFKLNEYDGNFSGFLQISKKYLGRNHLLLEHPRIRKDLIKVDGSGYDAQFFYFIAWDPLMREYHIAPGSERVIDDPVFRYRRIAYPILTKIFSLNIPEYYPAVMVFLLIGGAALCGFFMAKTAIFHGWNGFGGLLCLFIPGFWFSLSVATPEPLAAGFLAAGFFLSLRQRYIPAAIFFSIAALTRESTPLFILVFTLLEFARTRKIRGPAILATSFLPYAAWRIYVAITLFAMHGWRGFFQEPSTIVLPFMGIAQAFSRIAGGTYVQAITAQAVLLPILLLSIFAVCIFVYFRTKQPVGLIGAIYAFLALCLSHDKVWKDVSNVERLSYESFLCLALLYLSRPSENKNNVVFAGIFVFILVYSFFFMIRSDMLQVGLLWLLRT